VPHMGLQAVTALWYYYYYDDDDVLYSTVQYTTVHYTTAAHDAKASKYFYSLHIVYSFNL
jgi:hypothetical protein